MGIPIPRAFENIIFAKEQGAKLIVVDPIRTGLAAMADMWLQIKPGHDGLLAMSMIHEIISNNLFDEEFVPNWTVGFEALKDAAENFAAGIWLTTIDGDFINFDFLRDHQF